jgi:hypothetical protein
MTNQQHPITPPPELVQQWLCSDDYLWGSLEQTSVTITTNRLQNVATQAAQWGADMELEACGRWIEDQLCMPPDARADVITKLNGSRRPKPPSLKEQALTALRDSPVDPVDEMLQLSADVELIIRQALEALPNE